MPDSTYKLIQLVGISEKSFEDAVKTAIKRAHTTLDGLAWFEVTEQRGSIKNGKVEEFQVKINVAFKLKG